jgi:hypothetical protein
MNKIIFDIKPHIFAANQIKYYLKTYSDRIIKGIFPLNLLNTEYLANKYDKFFQFHDKLGYRPVENNDILHTIEKLDKQIIGIEKISNQNIFVATIYKSGDTIPFNSKTPIEGFLTKQQAIDSLRFKIKNSTPIYIYEVRTTQFNMIDGKLMATQVLNPINEESYLLTV